MERARRQRDIEDLEREVAELQRLATPGSSQSELERLQEQVGELRREFYAHLGAWQRTQLARHPQRPYTLDLIRLLFTDFSELHGDRCFGDDPAIVAGFARFHGRPVLVLGHQKGRDTKQRLARNFGQAKPEGYRKALRLMNLAAKFGRPVFTFRGYAGRLPRHRRRGTRPGRSHRPQPTGDGSPARCRSSSRLPAKAAPAVRWASPSATASTSWRTESTR